MQNTKMEKILITGGSGFVGSHLVERLIEQNYKITVVDDFSNSSKKNIQQFIDNIDLINLDISKNDWKALNKLNPDVIFHLATHPRSFSLQDPNRNLDVNVKGTLNILEYARKHSSKVIYTSNSGIYGPPRFLPLTEEHPDNPTTPYDANKLIGEHYGKIYHSIHGVYFISFRLATVYGERQHVSHNLGWHPLIPEFVENVFSNKKPIIHWDGKQTRDLIYVKDIVDCLILGANSTEFGGHVFNVGTNTETSVLETLELIFKITNKRLETEYREKLAGDISRMCVSYEKAKRLLGFTPKYKLDSGLRKYISWYTDQLKGNLK